jgi:hypothetical protein
MSTKWFHFSQNNSGGSFHFDAERGITHHVCIEAADAEHANLRAERIGLYFDGCDNGEDCSCCGDRWSRQWSDKEGTDAPMVYGDPAETYDPEAGAFGIRWMRDNPEVFVHYIGGAFKGFGGKDQP